MTVETQPNPDEPIRNLDKPLTHEEAVSLAIFAVNTVMYPDASSGEDIDVLEFRSEEVIEKLASLRRGTEADGTVIVSPTVASILHSLADAWQQEGEAVEKAVREHQGDYLAQVEAFHEDVAAQLRLLGNGLWGAGTRS